MENIIKRNRNRESFSTIPNQLLNDFSISAKARLLYVYLNSKPENWRFYNADLFNAIGCKHEALASYLKEITDKGWVLRKQGRKDDGGKWGGNDYIINTRPFQYQEEIDEVEDITVGGETPHTENPDTVKSGIGKNLLHSNTDTNNNNNNTKEKKKSSTELTDFILKLDMKFIEDNIFDIKKKTLGYVWLKFIKYNIGKGKEFEIQEWYNNLLKFYKTETGSKIDPKVVFNEKEFSDPIIDKKNKLIYLSLKDQNVTAVKRLFKQQEKANEQRERRDWFDGKETLTI